MTTDNSDHPHRDATNYFFSGNVTTSLHADGHKVREWPNGEEPRPLDPESIDLKVTDYCEAGCPFCHESSTKRGKHADPEFIFRLLCDRRGGPDGMRGPLEVAVGGGDPLSHPDLDRILEKCGSTFDRACNLTVNERNLSGDDSLDRVGHLMRLLGSGTVRGLGISVDSKRREESRFSGRAADAYIGMVHQLPNVVAHLIAGIDDWKDAALYPKILILGFKEYGFGVKRMGADVRENIRQWRYHLPHIIESRDGVTSFDNLALKQLRVRDVVPGPIWEGHYMGDDGQFTMYVDAVRQEYAKSSTSSRKPCGDMTLREMFADVRSKSVKQ